MIQRVKITADCRWPIKEMVRIIFVLDSQQAVIISPVEGCLPIWLVRIGLWYMEINVPFLKF